ncbi:MAG TPA: hypothetical protein DD738_14970 [Ruminiclostridium sp.]|jgi:hypothetical protein|nr:hypothetical protein [Ruminiclostridium sp.]
MGKIIIVNKKSKISNNKLIERRNSCMSFLDGNMKKQREANKKGVKNSTPQYTAEGSFLEEIAEDLSEKNNRVSSETDETNKQEQKSESGFKEEFSEDLMNDVSRFGVQSYSKAGVSFEKLSDTQAKINYSGLLAKNGAQDVFGVYGFGSNQKWEDVSTLTFNKESEGSFATTVPIEQGKNINFAFRDSAENWDNNSGMNYTFVN